MSNKTYFSELIKLLNSHKKAHSFIKDNESEPITRNQILDLLDKKIPFKRYLNGKRYVPSTIDIYRLMLTKLGYLKVIKYGVFSIEKTIPTDLTSSKLRKEYLKALKND